MFSFRFGLVSTVTATLLVAASVALVALTPAAASSPLFSPGMVVLTAGGTAIYAVNPSGDPNDYDVLGVYASADGVVAAFKEMAYDPGSGDLFVVDNANEGSHRVDGLHEYTARIVRISGADGTDSDVTGCDTGGIVPRGPANCFADAFGIGWIANGPLAGMLAVADPVRGAPQNDPNGEIWIVDPVTGDRQLLVTGGFLKNPHSVTADSSGTSLYVGDASSGIVRLSLDSFGQVTGQTNLDAIPFAVAVDWDATTDTLIVGAQEVGIFRVAADLSGFERISPLHPSYGFGDVAVEADGSIVSVGDRYQPNKPPPTKPSGLAFRLAGNHLSTILKIGPGSPFGLNGQIAVID